MGLAECLRERGRLVTHCGSWPYLEIKQSRRRHLEAAMVMGGKPGVCGVSEAKRRKCFKEKEVANYIKGCHEVKKDSNRKTAFGIGMAIGGSWSLDGQGHWSPLQKYFRWSREAKCQDGVGGGEDRR